VGETIYVLGGHEVPGGPRLDTIERMTVPEPGALALLALGALAALRRK